MPTAFGKNVVLPVLARLLKEMPDLTIDVELGGRAVDPAEEGLDAVVRFGELPGSGLVASRLCEVSFVACASPQYLALHGEPATPEDLGKHQCLGYATPWRDHYREWPFAFGGKQFTRTISGQLNVNHAEALLAAAIAGSGITMLASFVVHDAVRSGQLQIILRDYLAPRVPVSIVYLPGKQRSPRVRWFVDAIKSCLPSPIVWESILHDDSGQAMTITDSNS
jgi:LysR family transcriptional regulator for bpeEF and oprC